MQSSSETQHREEVARLPVSIDAFPGIQCQTLQGACRVTLFRLPNPAGSLHAFIPGSSLKPFGVIPSGLENVLRLCFMIILCIVFIESRL